MGFIDKFNEFKFNWKFLLLIIFMFFSVTGGTYAYLFSTGSVSSIITGDMAKVDLELDVTRVLPVDETVNSILLFQFDELASNLNKGCIDQDGNYSLCQLYEINLKNNVGGVNTKVKGSLSFDNASMPNLSWVLLGNTYSSSTTYTSDMMGDSFNTASSTYTNFVDSYLLYSGNDVTFYILVWVNEIDRIQYDNGSYTGVVRFEDSNGKGVTAEFGN